MTHSLVGLRQPVWRCVFSRSSLVLAIVLDFWLRDISAQAAHPVASEQDKKQHQVNNKTARKEVWISHWSII